jgi:excisionase family DNA binding protein
MKATDLAAQFGVSTRTVWSWVSRGLVPHYRLGRAVFFERKDIAGLMARSRYVGHHRMPLLG